MSDRVLNVVAGFLSIGIIWLCWELAGIAEWTITRILPPPTKFIQTIFDRNFQIGIGSQSATIYGSIGSSIVRVFSGLFIGSVMALMVGVFISSSVWIKRFFMPLIRLLAPIAPIAWIPLALVLFGISNFTAIFVVFMGVFFTLTIATVQAIMNVPEHLIDGAKTLGCNGQKKWLHVIFPAILPEIFTILRLNFIAAWMAVLAAEMTGLRDGLGAVIMIGRNLFDNNLILLGMALIGITGFMVDVFLRTVQKKYFWWGEG